jgi:hypothetical protein
MYYYSQMQKQMHPSLHILDDLKQWHIQTMPVPSAAESDVSETLRLGIYFT